MGRAARPALAAPARGAAAAGVTRGGPRARGGARTIGGSRAAGPRRALRLSSSRVWGGGSGSEPAGRLCLRRRCWSAGLPHTLRRAAGRARSRRRIQEGVYPGRSACRRFA